ncbi:MAG: PilZ domain-containing protein [Deltaproteobacteria bacterium]|nr:PilZ domain-containing protein [Deltaproteobacteria bacterium]
MGTGGLDGRIAPRFKTRIFGVFNTDIDLDETEMLMTNMSLGGAFIRTENPAQPGTPVTLQVYLKEDDPPLSVAGEVVWWRMPGHGEQPGMGVKFNQIASADLERMKAYLAGLVEADLFGD